MSDDHDLLIRMDEKLDELKTQFAAHLVAEQTARGALGDRVTALEQWKWRWAGAIAVLVLVLNFVGTATARILTR